MSLFLIGIIGACVGSFLGVLIDRLPQDKPVVFDRSRCDYCGRELSGRDLIPVISFILSKGRSSCCHKSLSWFYPSIELLTAALFVISFSSTSSVLLAVTYSIVGCILLVVFFTDLFAGVIPVLLVILGILVVGGYYVMAHVFFTSPLLGVAIAGGLFGFLILMTKGKGMGLGDLTYVILMGFILGFPNIITGLYIAFLTGAIVSLILVVAKKKKLRGGSVPFVPFLIFATIFTYVYGSFITAYFASYFPHF